MRLKEYTKEEIENGVIVEVIISDWHGQIYHRKPVVKKITDRTVMFDGKSSRARLSFSEFGLLMYSKFFCLESDIKELIEKYKGKTVELCEKNIAKQQQDIDKTKNLLYVGEEVR